MFGTNSGLNPLRQCFSVGHGINQYLPWKGGKAAADNKNALEFYEAVFGPDCQLSDATDGGPGFEFCLEELTSQTVGKLVRGGDQSLAQALRPYLKDLLTRRQNLRAATDLLAASAESDIKLPPVLLEVTAKDLFVALLLASPATERAALAAAYAGLRAPLPVIFRKATVHPATADSPASTELSTVVTFELLQKLACVPGAFKRFLVSVGTERVVGCGKTSLLRSLALTSIVDDDLDLHPGGPLHSPSCDLLCADSEDWVADVHGHWFALDEAFRTAVLALAQWGHAVVLVHCGLADFHPRTGVPRRELAALLTELQRAVAPQNVLVLLRDVAPASLASKQSVMEAALREFGSPVLLLVDNCVGARRAGVGERLRKQVGTAISEVAVGKASEVACAEALVQVHRAMADQGEPTDDKAPSKDCRSDLGARLHGLLDEASGKLTSTMFPMTTASRKLTNLRRAINRSSDSSEPPEISDDEVQALEKELGAASCSAVMKFFCEVMAARPPLATMTELGLYLAEWREPRVQPLLARQRELLEGKAGVAEDEVEAVSAELAAYDFSMDSFWVELELLATHKPGMAEAAKVKAGRQTLLQWGQPFQILHGRPLQMAGAFLRDVLEAIDAPKHKGLYVVSVIGVQSSAKSTLLNFLFGCGFAVRAGRCTRGLYASYFHPLPTGQSLLVLDSEGLLSLSSEGSVFDGQIALMCMACSHLVIVNQKGELSRQLQDLLEICLFAMQHLGLARIQPRLVFVLRDQHDRSRTVHEDMLKRMRSHMEDVAGVLGVPLDDLILLDGNAVFLLPSAVTSELRQGQEVCWTSELFAREVLALRREVFRCMGEDSSRQAKRAEFNSLANWYDYAASTWDTLDQFSEQLLHYRTIHEVKVRRELAEVAKLAVHEVLNSDNGFHARARKMVDRFVGRVHANCTRLDLETADLELGHELASLRNECFVRLEELFQERSADPRFNPTAKEQAKLEIRTPIEWAFENHLYTWKLHLKRASDEREIQELWIHFAGVLDRHLASSGHRSCLSPQESKELFNREWSLYEASFLARLSRLMKDRSTIVHEVTLLFNHAVGKLQPEAGTLALLKEIGPQQVTAGDSLMEQPDLVWEEQYFDSNWWENVKLRGKALLLQTSQEEPAGPPKTPQRAQVVPRLKRLVELGLQQFKEDVSSHGLLDETLAADGLRRITGDILREMEMRLTGIGSGTLKRPQMLHALQVALRGVCIDALVGLESGKQAKASVDLLAQKKAIEEHFLLIIQANMGDVERATNFAELYHRSLMKWLDHEATQLAADVRNQVLQEMPDPRKSSDRAFRLSFVARKWPDVLEYVLDTSSYLEKIYLSIFHQRKRSFVGPARLQVEKRVSRAYSLLKEVIGQWARDDGSLADGPMARGLAAGKAGRSVKDLKDFITAFSKQPVLDPDTAEAHKRLADCLPASADFQIVDPKLFADTVEARTTEALGSGCVHDRLVQTLDAALMEQSVQAWSLVHGCCERCPMCGSKCDLVGEHVNHHCEHHLFPAFHGWMDCDTGLPSFNHCRSAATRNGTYECKDGVQRKFVDYLRSDHPTWVTFLADEPAGGVEQDVQHLRAAWVNCRAPLLEYFSPMVDDCPQQWLKDHLEEDGALRKEDLEVAKDTIRSLRRHKWVPPDE